jgi:enoyl-CoA hydratase/carnithine racemase
LDRIKKKNFINRPISTSPGNSMPSSSTMELPKYRSLKTTSTEKGVLQVTFHNPDSLDLNLWSQDTQDELTDLVEKLRADIETKVVVFNSDIPRFFCAHVDTAVLSGSNSMHPVVSVHFGFGVTRVRD